MVNQIATLSFAVENNHASKEGSADFDEAIKACGYGKFHYCLLLLCGMMFLCVGLQNGINAYILPSAECDLRLSSEEKGLLNVAFLVGGVISSLFWGIYADAYGRKQTLLITLFADSILSMISSISQSFTLLLAFRGVSGFLIGAPGSLVYTYLGEFHSDRNRSKSICYVGFFWTLSWLVLPGLSWIILPLPFSIKVSGILYNSWRFLLALIGIPTFLVALVGITYPESPKFLLSQGKSDEALAILRKIYAVNTGQEEHDYPVKILLSEESSMTKDEVDGTSGRIELLLKNVWYQMRTIASPPLLKYSILCWTMFFSNMFGYYGFGLWLPELFNRFETYNELHPNSSVAVCELVKSKDVLPSGNGTMENALLLPAVEAANHRVLCSGTIGERVFINTLTINAVCLFGNIASGYLADRVGRRTMPVTTMLMAGLFGVVIYFMSSSLQILIVTCLFSLTISTANFVLGSVVVDIFPTHVGAVAICMTTCFGRIGAIASNLAFGMLLDISCEIPIFLVAAIVLAGGFLGLLIPVRKT
ncbi:synaptic vesicle glycoprotein 2C-like [Prorops nasuta]|uniref:synaptic vesicle glycoprotein 2C-like n=1 Tax=Prorops nasuta TaxID=863751 RepID=UPI0034CEF25E